MTNVKITSVHKVTNMRHRIALTKLRLSKIKITIETERYSRPFKRPEERFAQFVKQKWSKNNIFSMYTLLARKKDVLLEYLEKEYRIKISGMSPNKIFLFLKKTLAETLKYKN